jgi:hypothetical protein
VGGQEFAESARMLGCLYPRSEEIKKFLAEKLQTNNLGGETRDHYAFLMRNILL